MKDWKKLPKVELHRHLDASLRPQTIFDLAQKHNVDIKAVSAAEVDHKYTIRKPMKNLDDVLNAFWTTQKVLLSYEGIKRVAFENVEDCFREGTKLVELRFAPVYIAKGKKLGFDEIIEGVIDGITEGMEKYDIQVGLIHIMPRSLDLKQNIQSTDDILRYRKSSHKNADRLFGIDLADLETPESFTDYAPSIAKARKEGMGITIHSGEDSSADHVRKSIEIFHAERIGHGIQIAKDPEVMKLVKEKNVVLEVCPTSNWLTQCVKTIEEHPLKFLYDQGVKVTLNSDDPHIMGIDLVHEYGVAEKLGMTAENFRKMNQWALEKSFVAPDIKKKVSLI
ncbi:MAG: adenosine deaminase [Bacteriovoracaceae bacterium]